MYIDERSLKYNSFHLTHTGWVCFQQVGSVRAGAGTGCSLQNSDRNREVCESGPRASSPSVAQTSSITHLSYLTFANLFHE